MQGRALLGQVNCKLEEDLCGQHTSTASRFLPSLQLFVPRTNGSPRRIVFSGQLSLLHLVYFLSKEGGIPLTEAEQQTLSKSDLVFDMIQNPKPAAGSQDADTEELLRNLGVSLLVVLIILWYFCGGAGGVARPKNK